MKWRSNERRRHLCCFCHCETWQERIYAGFGMLAWRCGEADHGLIAFYHDEPAGDAEIRYWNAVMARK